jgi:hypothetical protein
LVRDNRAFTAFNWRNLGYLGYPGKILTKISEALYHINNSYHSPIGGIKIANRSARLRLAPFARVVLYNAAANGALGERAKRAGGKGALHW